MRHSRISFPNTWRERDVSRVEAGSRVQGWTNWATISQVLIILWLGASAVAIGRLLYLVNVNSPSSIYRVALLPLLLVLAMAMVAAFRLKRRYIPVLLLLAAAFVPFSLPTGTESRVVTSLVLTIGFSAVWFVGSLVTQRRFAMAPSRVNKPLIAFSAAVVVSLGWGMLLRDPQLYVWKTFTVVQLASAVVMIMLPAALLMVANFANDLRLLKVMVALMLAAGVLGLVKQFMSLPLPVNTDGLFIMWIVALSMGMALFDRALATWLRASLLALAAAWVYWGFVLNISWVAGWLPVLFCIAVVVFLWSRPLFVLMAVALAILLLTHQDYYFHTVVHNEEVQSLYTRLAAWAVNWSVAKGHLLFGTGPAGYAIYYVTYFPNEAMASHNNFLDILSETGLLGFGLLLWFFVEVLRLGMRLVAHLRGRRDFSEALAVSTLAGSLGALIMMGFGDWVIPFAYTQTIAGFDHAVYTWIFMGAMVALGKLALPAWGPRSGSAARSSGAR